MAATIAWLALLAAAAAVEAASHVRGARWRGISSVVRDLSSRPVGRAALLGLWAFVGLHVFARYTLPG
ncbi:MAG TPA: DUF6186 family protein [Acidimicrobiales bacterium]|nr:DUF6186 family protein [Acidimicrobiales bacterium]